MGKVSLEYMNYMSEAAESHIGNLAAESARVLNQEAQALCALPQWVRAERGLEASWGFHELIMTSESTLQSTRPTPELGCSAGLRATAGSVHLDSQNEPPQYSRVEVSGIALLGWEDIAGASFVTGGEAVGDILGRHTYERRPVEHDVRPNVFGHKSLRDRVGDKAEECVRRLATAQIASNVVDLLVRQATDNNPSVTRDLRSCIRGGAIVLGHFTEVVHPSANVEIFDEIVPLTEIPNHPLANPLPIK